MNPSWHFALAVLVLLAGTALAVAAGEGIGGLGGTVNLRAFGTTIQGPPSLVVSVIMFFIGLVMLLRITRRVNNFGKSDFTKLSQRLNRDGIKSFMLILVAGSAIIILFVARHSIKVLSNS